MRLQGCVLLWLCRFLVSPRILALYIHCDRHQTPPNHYYQNRIIYNHDSPNHAILTIRFYISSIFETLTVGNTVLCPSQPFFNNPLHSSIPALRHNLLAFRILEFFITEYIRKILDIPRETFSKLQPSTCNFLCICIREPSNA